VNTVYPAMNFSVGEAQVAIYVANRGEGLPKHEHPYMHITCVTHGACLIKTARRVFTLKAWDLPIELPANEWHEIEAEEDGTTFTNIWISN
jgi:quercetin dioxygenase-like cupin family protein